MLNVMEREDITVLVVEDDKLMNWSLASSLSKWGFAVQSVFTGSDAVSEIEKSGAGIVLLDYLLPDLDGLAVARRIREKNPQAVIFLMTAFELNELSPDAGLIDRYFNKPVDLQQVHEALAEIAVKQNRDRSGAGAVGF